MIIKTGKHDITRTINSRRPDCSLCKYNKSHERINRTSRQRETTIEIWHIIRKKRKRKRKINSPSARLSRQSSSVKTRMARSHKAQSIWYKGRVTFVPSVLVQLLGNLFLFTEDGTSTRYISYMKYEIHEKEVATRAILTFFPTALCQYNNFNLHQIY